MENKRKYKQYLYDSKINMPARTYYSKYQKKKKESTSTNETLSDLNNTFNNNETIQQESQITSQNENINIQYSIFNIQYSKQQQVKYMVSNLKKRNLQSVKEQRQVVLVASVAMKTMLS